MGAGAGFWHWKTHQVHTKLGSPTIQFSPGEKPGAIRLPKRVIDQTPWVTYGYDIARTRFAAPFKVRPPYRRLWLVQAGPAIEFPPAVAYGKVYIPGSTGQFLAVNSRTGRIVWENRYHNCTAASPTVAHGVVYQPYLPPPCDYGPRNVPGFVVALDARTGKELWRKVMAPSESSPLLLNGVLYLGSWDGKVYALDVKTHRFRWSTQTDAEVDSSAAYDRGMLFIGNNAGHLYALDPRTGRIRWRASSYSHFPNGREYFYTTPAVAYGRVFIGNTDGTLYAYGERTGDLLWAQRAGTYVYTSAAVWRRTVYVGTYDGYFSAFDAATGRLRWKYAAAGAVHGAPTVMDGLVYFSTCENCGRRASRYSKRGRRGTYALDARTGRLVWSFPDGRYSPIVADEQRAYLVGSGRIYGLAPCAPRTAPAARRRTLMAC